MSCDYFGCESYLYCIKNTRLYSILFITRKTVTTIPQQNAQQFVI